jgi:hypothetical protein
MDSDTALRSAAVNLADQMAEVIDAHIFEPDLGRVWAALLVAGGSQSSERVSELLGEDLDLVESTLAELEDFAAVRREGTGWCAETDPLRIAARFVRERELPLVNEVEEALLFARDRLRSAEGPDAEQARVRLQELVRNVALVRQLLKAVAASERLELDKLLSALSS